MKSFFIHILITITALLGAQTADAQSSPKVNAPVANFSIDRADAIYCANDSVKFSNESTGYQTLHWEFGDQIDTWTNSSSGISIIHRYSGAGVFTATLTAIDASGAQNIFTLDITINPAPQVEIIASSDTVFHEGSSVELTAQGDTYSSVEWSSGEISEVIIATIGGVYEVIVSNTSGCYSSDQITVEVIKDADSYKVAIANNILTPNDDGINDLLFLNEIEGYENTIDIQIYNQWGNLVYSNDNYRNNWGGLSNNEKELDTGTYYIIIRSEGRNVQTGYIDIIR